MSEFVAPVSGPRAPSRAKRVFAVWVRHYRVYMDTIFANATPAVLEPTFFLLAVGLGVGRFIDKSFLGLSYPAFMAPGLLAMTAAYTASFESTWGTFIRLRFQATYDGMRATPVTPADIFIGELLWCASKGLLFSLIVGLVLTIFGLVRTPAAVAIPLIGFVTATVFGGIGFFVTSFVKNINHFQFYFTIVLTPLVFFSGLTFPVDTLPAGLAKVAYALPMFHVIETFRLVVSGPAHLSVPWAWLCPFVVLAWAVVFGTLGVLRMRTRLLR